MAASHNLGENSTTGVNWFEWSCGKHIKLQNIVLLIPVTSQTDVLYVVIIFELTGDRSRFERCFGYLLLDFNWLELVPFALIHRCGLCLGVHLKIPQTLPHSRPLPIKGLRNVGHAGYCWCRLQSQLILVRQYRVYPTDLHHLQLTGVANHIFQLSLAFSWYWITAWYWFIPPFLFVLARRCIFFVRNCLW